VASVPDKEISWLQTCSSEDTEITPHQKNKHWVSLTKDVLEQLDLEKDS